MISFAENEQKKIKTKIFLIEFAWWNSVKDLGTENASIFQNGLCIFFARCTQ